MSNNCEINCCNKNDCEVCLIKGNRGRRKVLIKRRFYFLIWQIIKNNMNFKEMFSAIFII